MTAGLALAPVVAALLGALRHLAAGATMATGAALVPGGNDGVNLFALPRQVIATNLHSNLFSSAKPPRMSATAQSVKPCHGVTIGSEAGLVRPVSAIPQTGTWFGSTQLSGRA